MFLNFTHRTAADHQDQQSAAAASPSPTEDAVTSQEVQPSPPADAQVAAVSSSTEEASSAPASTARSVQTKVVTASRSSTVVQVTASASASASAAAASTDEKIAGLPKTTFIAIIVVAAIVALAGIGWTVFRKLRLGPSRKFDEKMRPIDFSPHNDTLYVHVPFSSRLELRLMASMEKSHHRSSSNSSAAMQREEFVAELDSKHVDGVPDHDFTAGGNMAGQGAYEDYHQDPYASAEAYEYDAAYHYDDVAVAQNHQYDQPTQDTGAGYTDLQRGNSIGSGSGHGHGHHQASYPVEQFPMPDHYLGRPTGGAEGPYVTPRIYLIQS